MNQISVIMDLPTDTRSHTATIEALGHAGATIGSDLPIVVVRTPDIDQQFLDTFGGGVVIGPGSPYEVPENADEVIRFAREREVPLVGTWGGFQHVLLEHARTLVGIADAEHNEYAEVEGKTATGTTIVSQIECSIKGKLIDLELTPGSHLARLHGAVTGVAEYATCAYGLDPAVQDIANQHGMIVSAIDDSGEVRAIERPDHPYFIGMVYQPQLRTSKVDPHPVFVGLVEAAMNAPMP